jgi:hypothetical protein
VTSVALELVCQGGEHASLGPCIRQMACGVERLLEERAVYCGASA